jgi:GT2 family glycosyltransferase
MLRTIRLVPTVTALMPVKEVHPEYLRRALASLATQTSPEWRLLVIVDEEPAPALAAILEPVLGRDERCRLIRNEGRKLAGALNTGMRHAETEFVAILLADDMWAPEAVATLSARIAASPEVDFFHSGRIVVDADDAPISGEYAGRAFTVDEFVNGSPVKHLLCWRRSAGLAIGGLDERSESVGPDDYDFPWSMAQAGYRFEAIPDCLYLYRDHRDGFRLTTHLPRSTHTRELRRILRKHGVPRLTAERKILGARAGYLRQCLYRSPLDRWLKERRGFDPQQGWRERYR